MSFPWLVASIWTGGSRKENYPEIPHENQDVTSGTSKLSLNGSINIKSRQKKSLKSWSWLHNCHEWSAEMKQSFWQKTCFLPVHIYIFFLLSVCQFQFLGRFSKILRRWEELVTPAARRSSSVMPLWNGQMLLWHFGNNNLLQCEIYFFCLMKQSQMLNGFAMRYVIWWAWKVFWWEVNIVGLWSGLVLHCPGLSFQKGQKFHTTACKKQNKKN